MSKSLRFDNSPESHSTAETYSLSAEQKVRGKYSGIREILYTQLLYYKHESIDLPIATAISFVAGNELLQEQGSSYEGLVARVRRKNMIHQMKKRAIRR